MIDTIAKPFEKFVRLVKVEDQKDGTLLAHGLLTAQEPDQENEVCDYESTVPYFKALVARYTKATEATGAEVSLFPVREMHSTIAAGAGRKIEFDDVAKTITITVHVVDRSSAEKVRKGVLVGFSQGGTYVKTWKKGENTWYTADPGEASLVDSPCLKRAMIDSIAEKSFQYVKENGSTEMRKFVAPKADPPSEEKLTLSEKLLAIAKAKGVEPRELAERVAQAYRFLSSDSLAKGMFTVQETARIVDTLSWVTASCTYEANNEGDGSAVPADMKAVLEDLIEVFRDLVEEETNELISALEDLAAAKGKKMELTKAQIDNILAKAKSAKAHLQTMKAMATDHCDKASAMHKAHADKMSAACDKALKAIDPDSKDEKDEKDDDAEKAARAAELAKAAKCEHDKSYKESCDDCGRVVKAKETPAAEGGLTKADLDTAVAEAVKKAVERVEEQRTTGQVRGTLAPRPGETVLQLEPIAKSYSHASAGNTQDELADAGI